MMDSVKRAVLKDQFLRYARDQDSFFEPQELCEQFMAPSLDLQEVVDLINEIRSYDPDLMDVMSGNGSKIFLLSATPNTDSFIKQGGFKKMVDAEEKKWEVFLSHLRDTRILANNTEEISSHQNNPDWLPDMQLLWALLFGVVASLFISLYTYFNVAARNKNYDPPAVIENRIQNLENRVLQENLQLRREMLELKYRLRSLQGVDTVPNP